ATALLISCLARQQENSIGRLEQHLRGEKKILMYSHRNLLERLSNILRLRKRIQKISADLIEQVQVSLMRRVNHLNRVQPRRTRSRESPLLRDTSSTVWLDRKPAGKLIRHGSDFCAALNTRVTANSHQAAFFAADEASRQRQIDDGFYVLHAVAVLCDSHRPDKHPALCLCEQRREQGHLLSRCPGHFFEDRP